MRKILIFLIPLYASASLYCIDGFAWGADQHTRIQMSENSLLLAPGAELFLSLYVTEKDELRAGVFAGRYFGTTIGGSFQYNRYFGRESGSGKTSSMQPGLGLGLYGAWQDILFIARSSRDFMYPAPASFGAQINLIPFRVRYARNTFSFFECSWGTDLRYPFRVNHLDIRLCQFSFRF